MDSDSIDAFILNNSQSIKSSDFFNQYHRCTHSDGCDYHCSANKSCSSYVIECDNPTGCNILCQNYSSCSYMTVIANSFDSMELNILCNGTNACQNMEINAADIHSLNVHCISPKSCSSVNIFADDTKNDSHISITCHQQYSCNHLYLSSNGQNIKLKMHQYSQGIILDINKGLFANTIQCGLNEIITFNSTQSIEEIIALKFDSQLFPCSNITILCGSSDNETEYDKYCTLEYAYRNASELNSSSCFRAALYDIIELQCNGKCPLLAPTPSQSLSEMPTTEPTVTPTSKIIFDLQTTQNNLEHHASSNGNAIALIVSVAMSCFLVFVIICCAFSIMNKIYAPPEIMEREIEDDDIFDIFENIEMAERERIDKGDPCVYIWFEHRVNIKDYNNAYASLFISNGYDQLDYIQSMDVDDLMRIGITNKEHINRIMMEIDNLNFEDQQNEEEGSGDSGESENILLLNDSEEYVN